MADRDRQKDVVSDYGPEVSNQDRAMGSLRPKFWMAGAEDVIPSKQRQLQSDVLFDMFNVVQPGYGLGADNKLYLENEQNAKFIRNHRPLYAPRKDDGPEMGLHPMPWQFQNIMPPAMIDESFSKIERQLNSIEKIVSTIQGKTVSSLPRDIEDIPSSSGLSRPASVFVPAPSRARHSKSG